MGYYIRVLGTQDPDIHLDELLDNLQVDGLNAQLALAESDTPDKWTLLNMANDTGDTLAQIERNPVVEGELGKDELEEFVEKIKNCSPTSAVTWLTAFFEKVKVIYAFRLLNAAFDNSNFDIISSIKSKIWNKTGGILQADNEGFSNEEGYHILWQFSDDVTGNWSCAVLDESGQWQNFVMDLGDKVQREEFFNGQVPENSERI